MSFDFDLFVIGGGSGGVRAARLAAEKGLRVALAEGDRMGGTCVIRGCVPKKLMLFASDFSTSFELAAGYGWEAPQSGFEWAKFHQKLRVELERLEGIYQSNLEKAGVRIFKDWAALDGAHNVTLDSGLRFSSERILLATGGRPFVPEMEGAELAITSDDVFHFEALPQSMIIIGGGYIACEFASIFHRLGVKVTQIYRGELILRGYDEEARAIISEEMTKRGIDLRYGINLIKIEEADDGKHAHLDNGDVLIADEVLFATGRVPNIETLNLGSTQVKTQKGKIVVDPFSQTDEPSIYAVGDVTGRAGLTPVAIREAVNFIQTVYDNTPATVDYDVIPTAIFTRPELGAVGLTEETARARGHEVKIFATRFRPMLAAFAGTEDVMYMKLVVDAQTDQVLGVHLAGYGAGEMIQLVAIAVGMKATKAQFDQTIAVHPTAAEELVTLKTPRKS